MTPTDPALHAILALVEIERLRKAIRDALESLELREPHARMVLQMALRTKEPAPRNCSPEQAGIAH